MTPRRRELRAAGRLALAAAGLAVLWLALTATGRYLVRAAWAEARILRNREPIPQLVASNRTEPVTRAKLALVLAARQFAVDSAGLRASESFTTFSQLERDTLVLVLSAAERDRLKPYTWWFPIVGRVPYKGFFDFRLARATAAQLRREGLDTYLRPAPAFSTLGWFNDPLLSTTLAQDSLELATTVVHELLHNTFYAPGEAVFNESFANFVGSRGAAWFFRARGQPAAAAEVDRRWADELRLGAFWTTLYRALDSAYTALPEDDRVARLRARDTIYTRARRVLASDVAPRLSGIPPEAAQSYAARIQLDNAALLARRVYLTDLDLFEAVYAREARDLRRTIARVVALARARPDEPYTAVREWLDTGG